MHGMMDIVHDETIGLILEHPVHEVTDTGDWKKDGNDLYYLPVLATQHEVPLPIDFKRQRITSRCNSPPSSSERGIEKSHPVLVDKISANKVQIEETSFAVVSYAGHSKKGYAPYNMLKKNQDSILMLEDSASKSLLLLCLDGHGEVGHKISQCIKKEIEARLFSHPFFGSDMKRAISDVVATIERNLLMDPTIDTNFSGTTLVLTIIRGHSITIANIGDSRITLGRKSDKSGDRSNSKSALSPMLAIPLSVDHKPDIPKEKERILRNGGRVFAVEYEDGCKGPERVWLSNMNIPGLAMSRSLCDQVAHSVGVSSVPEFFERSLDPSQDAVLIIATDGLWEFISDQEAIDIVATAAEPSAAVNALIREATARWLVNEKVVDDISICVAFLLGFSADCVILDCQDNLHDIREENV